jgi:FG-GAP-like repeat/Domain of unknown function (DUF4214)
MAARWWRTRQGRDSRQTTFQPRVEGLEERTLLSFAAPAPLSAQSRPAAVAVGDFNGDGKLDFVTANNNSASVSVFLGHGDGTFADPANYGVGSQPSAVVVGDFNGDGKPDLAVANANAFAVGNSISVLLNRGDGTFQDPVNFGAGVAPSALAVGDFDGDGKLDLAVVNTFSSNVGVLLGHGDGTFADPVFYQTGSQPRAITVADFNGDGKPDLAVANSQSNTVTILLNRGQGTFQANPTVTVGTSPVAIVAADFNGDGQPDLAVANAGGFSAADGPNGGNVSVLLSNGDGTFQPAVNYAADFAPSALAVGDFDGDGRLDLMAANQGSNTVSLLPGRGDGTFGGAIGFTAGANPSALAAGDFDGDGFADLVVSVGGASNVALLRNQPDASVQGRTPNQRYVARLYLDLLERPVDPTGLQVWAGLLDQGTSRMQVVQQIEASQEFQTLQVRHLYQELLHRDPEQAGLDTWVRFLGNGGTVLQVRAQILGSGEYLADSGGSTAGFLSALYQDTLGRTIDATGGVVWAQALAQGQTRSQVAAAVLNSQETYYNFIVSAYQALLRRTPDANGLQYFTTALNQGQPGEWVVAQIASSDEYYARL